MTTWPSSFCIKSVTPPLSEYTIVKEVMRQFPFHIQALWAISPTHTIYGAVQFLEHQNGISPKRQRSENKPARPTAASFPVPPFALYNQGLRISFCSPWSDQGELRREVSPDVIIPFVYRSTCARYWSRCRLKQAMHHKPHIWNHTYTTTQSLQHQLTWM